MKTPGDRCYECQNYNHVDCRKAKGKGKCNCLICQSPGSKYIKKGSKRLRIN